MHNLLIMNNENEIFFMILFIIYDYISIMKRDNFANLLINYFISLL
jgi:hypothetical protein